MTNVFRKTDLAGIAALAAPLRLLGLLAAFRFVAAGDLGAVGIGGSEVEAAEAAGALLRLRFQRRVTDERQTEVLALARAGALALARDLAVEPGSVPYVTKSMSRRSAMFMDHRLGISALALVAAQSLARKPAPRLLSWETDAERLATSAHFITSPGVLERRPLVADALAVVDGPRGAEGLLVEVDRGTESPSPRGFLGTKYRGYLAWWQAGGARVRFGVPTVRVLTVTPDDRRAERLRDCCAEATGQRGSGLFWFASEAAVKAAGLLAPVWSTTRLHNLALWS